MVFLEKSFWQQHCGRIGGGENGGREAVRNQAYGREKGGDGKKKQLAA